jgi:hypothetical protein
MFVCDRCLSSNKIAEPMAILISRSVSAAVMDFSCKNSVLPLVSTFGT